MTKCKVLTREEEITFCNDYTNSRLSKNELIEKYQISNWTFTSIRERHHIPKRKRIATRKNLIACDERFFEIIDTKEKAYWLGFIAADGCILERKSKNKPKSNEFTYILSIGLATKDISHLEKFKKDLKCEYPIKIEGRNHSKNGKYYETALLRVSRTVLCEDLMKQGVGRDKSKNLQIPNLSEDLLVHWIRGYFDGDGSWQINGNHLQFGLISSVEDFTKNIQEFIRIRCQLDNLTSIYFNKNAWQFSYHGNDQCKRIYDYFYSDGGPWLDRKYELSTKHFENCGPIINKTRNFNPRKIKSRKQNVQSPLNILLFGDKNAK